MKVKRVKVLNSLFILLLVCPKMYLPCIEYNIYTMRGENVNKKKIVVICLSVAVIFVLCIRMTKHFENDDTGKNTVSDISGNKTATVKSTDKTSSNEFHISRAHAIKMITLLRYSHDEIAALPRIINYTDSGEDKWFDKYINAAAAMGMILGENECHPLEELTYEDCIVILEQLVTDSGGTVLAAVNKRIGNNAVTDAVPTDKWLELYSAIGSGEISSTAGLKFTIRPLKQEDVFLMSIIKDKDSDTDANSWEVATSSGAYHFDGFALDAYTNTTLNILSDGNEIIYIYMVILILILFWRMHGYVNTVIKN